MGKMREELLSQELEAAFSDWDGDFVFEIEMEEVDDRDTYFTVFVTNKRFKGIEHELSAKVSETRYKRREPEIKVDVSGRGSWVPITTETLFAWMWFDLANETLFAWMWFDLANRRA